MSFLQTTVVSGDGWLPVSAAKVSDDIANSVSGINWMHPSWDLFILLFFVVAVFFYGMMLGRDRIVTILISIYMSLAVVSNAPFIGQLRPESGGYAAVRILSFIGIFVLIFFLLSRSSVMRSFASVGYGSWWQVWVFSVFHVGLMVSITLTLLPPEAAAHLAPVTRGVFASDIGRFLWIVAPILGIVMLKSGGRRDDSSS
ncbi:hypothetical protein JW899_04215 [Candidatus Uhrbacteria bacterium]|nr:hypothetical protein [Candidatus Uhrbacteria bacterium]